MDILKSIIQHLINDRSEEASSELHTYMTDKIRVSAGLGQEVAEASEKKVTITTGIGVDGENGMDQAKELRDLKAAGIEVVKVSKGTGGGGNDEVTIRGTEKKIRTFYAKAFDMSPDADEIDELFESKGFKLVDKKDPIAKFDDWVGKKDLWHPNFPEKFADCVEKCMPDIVAGLGETLDIVGRLIADSAHSFDGEDMKAFITYAKKNTIPMPVGDEDPDEDKLEKYVTKALAGAHLKEGRGGGKQKAALRIKDYAASRKEIDDHFSKHDWPRSMIGTPQEIMRVGDKVHTKGSTDNGVITTVNGRKITVKFADGEQTLDVMKLSPSFLG